MNYWGIDAKCEGVSKFDEQLLEKRESFCFSTGHSAFCVSEVLRRQE